MGFLDAFRRIILGDRPSGDGPATAHREDELRRIQREGGTAEGLLTGLGLRCYLDRVEVGFALPWRETAGMEPGMAYDLLATWRAAREPVRAEILPGGRVASIRSAAGEVRFLGSPSA